MLILTKHSPSICRINCSGKERKHDFGHKELSVQQGTGDHKCRNCKVCMSKTGCIITRMKRHVKSTQIMSEDYLWKMYISNRPHTDNKLNEFIDHFSMLNQH